MQIIMIYGTTQYSISSVHIRNVTIDSVLNNWHSNIVNNVIYIYIYTNVEFNDLDSCITNVSLQKKPYKMNVCTFNVGATLHVIPNTKLLAKL